MTLAPPRRTWWSRFRPWQLPLVAFAWLNTTAILALLQAADPWWCALPSRYLLLRLFYLTIGSPFLPFLLMAYLALRPLPARPARPDLLLPGLGLGLLVLPSFLASTPLGPLWLDLLATQPALPAALRSLAAATGVLAVVGWASAALLAHRPAG